MAIPAGVMNVHVSHAQKFVAGGMPSQVTRYTYMIGNQGPFTLEYPEGTDAPDKVSADMQKMVTQLQALGLYKPA